MAVDYTTEIENTLEAFRSLIETGATAYLDGIVAAKADGISLPAFRDVKVTAADPFVQSKIPVCLIYPENGMIGELAAGFDELTMTMIVMVVVDQGSADILATRLLRYVEALRQLIRDNQQMSGKVDQCRVTGFEIYPAIGGEALGIATLDVEIILGISNQ